MFGSVTRLLVVCMLLGLFMSCFVCLSVCVLVHVSFVVVHAALGDLIGLIMFVISCKS